MSKPTTRTAKLETFQDTRGDWRWRLRAGNGRIVATGESHDCRSKARRAGLGAVKAALDVATSIAEGLRAL